MSVSSIIEVENRNSGDNNQFVSSWYAKVKSYNNEFVVWLLLHCCCMDDGAVVCIYFV